MPGRFIKLGLTLLIFSAMMGFAAEPRSFLHPDRISYDSQCLTIDGKDVFIYSGSFHYFRCPKELWPDRFQKIKDAGFNAVETYVPWNMCEQQMPAGKNDFSKVNLADFNAWLTMAESYGFYIIVRPGPYICAEWATGGFPEWLMTKKPEHPLRSEAWLRSDDPIFLAWSKHWYDEVCPVIAKHQITRKAPGHPGVVLVQMENEYDFSPRLPDEAKINHIKALAEYARADGIDVPLITCWTHQVRGSDDPVLRQIFDCCNFYPFWNVDGTLKDLEKLHEEQPDAPLGTTELQGGWFSKMGGKLSADQDGLTASQINNLTLFCIQNGETFLNYYMLFGGSNLGDWAARDITTTYDYNAPIREWGGIGDRYKRVWAIGHMLQEHGAKLARSVAVDCDVTTSQNDVTVAMRQATDGSRYLFVRTSQHTEPREGSATVAEKTGDTNTITFNYNLEPFGSTILYLPPGATNADQGEWLPKAAPAIEHPTNLPPAVTITSAKCKVDPGPSRWRKLQPGEGLAQAGIYDSRFIFYRILNPGRAATNLVVKYPKGDAVLAVINGKPTTGDVQQQSRSNFSLPAKTKEIDMLYENRGFVNGGNGMEQQGGITATARHQYFGSPYGVEENWWRPDFKDKHWTTITFGGNWDRPQPDVLLTWYRMKFTLPPANPGIWVPWRLHLEATGNGFLYLNGHALGRYWEAGPQHDFFLPECWLNFGNSKANNITLNLRPIDRGADIKVATVEPYADSALMK